MVWGLGSWPNLGWGSRTDLGMMKPSDLESWAVKSQTLLSGDFGAQDWESFHGEDCLTDTTVLDVSFGMDSSTFPLLTCCFPLS